jgi:hypothetical protein
MGQNHGKIDENHGENSGQNPMTIHCEPQNQDV